MTLRNFRIGTRLGFGFAISLLLVIGTLITSNILSAKNREDLLSGMNNANNKVMLAKKMKETLLEGGIAMRNMGISSEVNIIQGEKTRMQQKQSEYNAARDKLTSSHLNGEETKILNNISELDAGIGKNLKEAIEMLAAFNSEGANKILSEKIDPLHKQILIQVDQLVDVEQNSAKKIQQDVITISQEESYLIYVISVVASLLGGLVAWRLTKSITVPLKGAVKIAQRVASGQLASNFIVKGTDEISILLSALKEMDESLCNIVGQVRSGTETITRASIEIASGNSDLSTRTESQASSLEETASAMEELTATVKQNADSAERANQLVVKASSLATKSNGVVGSVISTMESIKNSSNKIVDITAVIDGIAFQTNILALNAAVEAARAGEHGRGFAVVAAEVRTLSQRSATAAKEIKALIADSVNKIDTGSKLVDEAGKAMAMTVESVSHVTEIMSEIAEASKEQSTGISEINNAIVKMDNMTQQNSALVEEAAAAAESMQQQAVNLSEIVSVFKLGV